MSNAVMWFFIAAARHMDASLLSPDGDAADRILHAVAASAAAMREMREALHEARCKHAAHATPDRSEVG